MTSTISVPATYPATQLVRGGEGPALLVNTDIANTVWCGDANSVQAKDVNQTAALDPGDSIIVDGENDFYGIVAGTPVVVKKFKGAQNFTTGVTVPQELANITALAITPAANTIGPYNVTGFTSYDIAMYFHNTLMNTVGSQLTLPVLLTWYADAALSLVVYQERWDVWISGDTLGLASNACVASGYGPMHGAYLTVTFLNTFNLPGAMNNVTCDLFNLYGSQRNVDRSIWKQQAPDVVTNGISRFTGAANPAINNNLFQASSIALAANSTQWIPIGLFAGLAVVNIHVQTATLSNEVALAAAYPESVTSGGVFAGGGVPGCIFEFPNDTTFHQFSVALPKCPTFIVVKNGTTAQTMNFSVTAVEAA